MNRTGSAEPTVDELHARIAAGSRDVTDYLELANLLRAAPRFQKAAGIYEHGLQRDFPSADKAHDESSRGGSRRVDPRRPPRSASVRCCTPIST